MRVASCLAATIMLFGCSENAEDLVAKSAPVVVDSTDGYQTVYRRLSKQYDCLDGAWAGTFASSQVDRELYTDLGFGELALRQANISGNNYFNYIKVSKRGSGSRTEVYSANSLQADKEARMLADVAVGRRAPDCKNWL